MRKILVLTLILIPFNMAISAESTKDIKATLKHVTDVLDHGD